MFQLAFPKSAARCARKLAFFPVWLKLAVVMQKLFTVILPAAGNSTRFALGDKLLMDLNGRSILQRSVELFTIRDDVAAIILATAPERFALYEDHLKNMLHGKSLHIVAGGRERWESVQKALNSGLAGTEFVAIHDAARPLTPTAVIDAVFAAAIEIGAALPVLAEPATLKRVDATGRITATVSRSGLHQAQTPQCFQTKVLQQAFVQAVEAGTLHGVTDDAQLVEMTDQPVRATAGSAMNIKITIGEDLRLAGAILEMNSRGSAGLSAAVQVAYDPVRPKPESGVNP